MRGPTQPALEQKLVAFLKRASAKPFCLGLFDCGIWLADWCVECRGVDPAAEMRGRYETLEQALALVKVRSLPSLLNRLFCQSGIYRTREPVYGDAAAIVLADGAVRGAIVTSGYVVIAHGGGISRVAKGAARRVAAWAL